MYHENESAVLNYLTNAARVASCLLWVGCAASGQTSLQGSQYDQSTESDLKAPETHSLSRLRDESPTIYHIEPVRPTKPIKCKKADTGPCWGWTPNTPFWKSKGWWTGEGALIAMILLNDYAARRVLSRGIYAADIFGSHRSNHSITLDTVFRLGAGTGLHIASHQVEKEDKLGWRIASDLALPTVYGATILPGVMRNFRKINGNPCRGTNLSC